MYGEWCGTCTVMVETLHISSLQTKRILIHHNFFHKQATSSKDESIFPNGPGHSKLCLEDDTGSRHSVFPCSVGVCASCLASTKGLKSPMSIGWCHDEALKQQDQGCLVGTYIKFSWSLAQLPEPFLGRQRMDFLGGQVRLICQVLVTIDTIQCRSHRSWASLQGC